MATLVLQYAGAALGGMLGGPIGAVVGRALGAIGGGFIDRALFGSSTRRSEGPRLDDLRIMASAEGSPVPRIWGRMRLGGQVIWATNFEEVVSTRTESASAKGAPAGPKTKVTEYEYFANFAVALCEGEISRIGRCWADGKILDLAQVTHRFYTGSEDQLPDSLIIAKEGADNAPAYRGTAYVVFERLPLARFGNRLPQLSFELFRPAGGMAEHVRAVNIIPGATEFGYDTEIVTSEPEEGETAPENAHASPERSDWEVSLDDLQASAPHLGSASLVVSWFGDDLRCGTCLLKPGVTTAAKETRPYHWRVAGLNRDEAHVVSEANGASAFGGTPSDASVIRAIADLKARGLKVTLYPFILMDIPAGNVEGQPAYPWRGRISCDPPPGEPGSPDKTSAVKAQIDAFIGTAVPADFTALGGIVLYSGPEEWSLRRMVLHYAKLCAVAGGVDAFLIGSELRGLTTLRDGPASYPFVAALQALAADVKSILPDAEVSYAADWSEYFGHQPEDGSGDVFFHLDPLWASDDIAFIGIDNYMPLTDWRDGRSHRDVLDGWRSIGDLDYLKSRIAGGEGYDWFYASAGDRDAQVRTPITDGAYGKPWVFRFKDVKSWWENAHHDRPGGVENASPTDWVPRSKPVRFTEAGCAAIDKGANQPNIFIDPKSAESGLPYHSNGARDDWMQARVIQAIDEYWSAPGEHNPVSAIYGGPMVEASDIHLWAWDARPFPDFPARADVWGDAGNYECGHWLNGRIAAAPLGRLIEAICDHYEFADADASALPGLIDGAIADAPMSARDLIEPMARAFCFDAVETEGRIVFRPRDGVPVMAIDGGILVERKADEANFAITRAQETELPNALKLAYAETAREYRMASVMARRLVGSSLREANLELPCAVPQALAQARCDIMLQEAWAGRETVAFNLPPSLAALEPGDAVTVTLNGRAHDLRIAEIADAEMRRVRAVSHDAEVYRAAEAPARGTSLPVVPVFGRPLVEFLDLPIAGGDAIAHAPWIAAHASPWPGSLSLLKQDGAASFSLNRVIPAPAVMGTLLDPLPQGPLGRYDRANRFRVKLSAGALASIGTDELLGGANAAAIGSPETGFEIIQFRDAELIAARTYELSFLLRGQSGSEPEMLPLRDAGCRFVLLGPLVIQPDLTLDQAGLDHVWRIGPSSRDHGDPAYVEHAHRGLRLGLRPRHPVHLRAHKIGGDVHFSWIRRGRIDADQWEGSDIPLGEDTEAYRVTVRDGDSDIRTVDVTSPQFIYAAADIVSDFGSPPSFFTLRIHQLSQVYGPGAPLEATIHV